MRKVEKEKDAKGKLIIPEILNNAEINFEWEKYAKQELKPPDSMKISKKLISELNKYYYGKCAYCESNCEAEIEHYRPKSHYFWLYYEWSNLFPVCHDCNKVGEGKGIQFPVMGRKETSPQFKTSTGKLNKNLCKHNEFPLKAEKPYVLHPEYDNPKEFFEFKINEAKVGIDIVGIDTEGRGDKTKEVCNLNRETLRTNRQEKIENILEQIQNILVDGRENKLQDKQIEKNLLRQFISIERKSLEITRQFTLLYNFTIKSFENFSNIILPFYEESKKTKKIVAKAFKLYKTV